jgi:hypothetical protein
VVASDRSQVVASSGGLCTNIPFLFTLEICLFFFFPSIFRRFISVVVVLRVLSAMRPSYKSILIGRYEDVDPVKIVKVSNHPIFHPQTLSRLLYLLLPTLSIDSGPVGSRLHVTFAMQTGHSSS